MRGDDQRKVGAAVTQARQQGLRQRDLLGQHGLVLRGFFFGQQHDNLARAIGHSRQPHFQAQAGGVPQAQGNHARRQALHHAQLSATSELFDQTLALPLAVQKQRSVAPTGGLVGRQERADFFTLLGRTRVGIAQRARGAGGGAGSAAHAQMGVDDDLLACLVRTHGLGRTDVDAGAAAGFVVATVGAKLLLVLEKTRLLELAHQPAQLQQGLHITPVPAEIALRQRVLQEGR